MLRYSSPRRIKIRGSRTRYFYSRVYDTETRKRHFRSTGRTSLTAAQEQVKTWEIEDARTGRVQKPPEQKPLGQAIKEWLQYKTKKLTPEALEGYRAYTKGWTENLGVGISLRGLDQKDVERHFDLRAETAAAGTLNRERQAIRAFFKWARGRKWLEDDLAASIERRKEPKRTIRALSDDEAAKLLTACSREYTVTKTGMRQGSKEVTTWEQRTSPPAWLHPTVMLLWKTGMRLGTLAALQWEHVDLPGRTLRLPPEIMKTDEGLDVLIDDETAALLGKLKARANSMLVMAGLPHRTVIRRALLQAAKRAGIRPLRVHDLRASWISRAYRAGVDMEVTASMAGHADVRTTKKHYIAFEEQELRKDAMKKLSKKSKSSKGGLDSLA